MTWKWYGHPAHLCVSSQCRFHLATELGNGYIVSTVGDYFPLSEGKRARIGLDRFFETMVFRAGKPCAEKNCGCGLPEISGDDLDFYGYNTAGDATSGHMAMCKKWSKRIDRRPAHEAQAPGEVRRTRRGR